MAVQRLVDASAEDIPEEDVHEEISLRPKTFDEYIGQDRLKKNLRLAIDAAKKRGEPLLSLIHI